MKSVSAFSFAGVELVDDGQENDVVVAKGSVDGENGSAGFCRGEVDEDEEGMRVWDVFGLDSRIYRCFCSDFYFSLCSCSCSCSSPSSSLGPNPAPDP